MSAAEGDLFRPLCADLLAAGRTVRFLATGTSMYPAIQDGDWVTVEPLRPEPLKRGDVVLYRGERGITAHRVTGSAMDRGALATLFVRADNGGAPAEHVDPGRVLGRVVSVERGARRSDPASMRSRLFSAIWRAFSKLRRMLHGPAVSARRLLLRGPDARRSANAGGWS